MFSLNIVLFGKFMSGTGWNIGRLATIVLWLTILPSLEMDIATFEIKPQEI